MILNSLADGPGEDIQIADEAHVLAMDDLTDASDNEPETALLPIEQVEIVPFPNFDNLQPLMILCFSLGLSPFLLSSPALKLFGYG
jgi:hypothetical protein